METDTVTLTEKKPLMLVRIDDTGNLEWVLDHFFTPHAPNFPFELGVVHAKPSPVSVIGLVGPSAAEVVKSLHEDLKRTATRILDKVKKLYDSKSLLHIRVETWEGDMLGLFSVKQWKRIMLLRWSLEIMGMEPSKEVLRIQEKVRARRAVYHYDRCQVEVQ